MQMDYINIFEPRKYMMHLDTLDLALLPTKRFNMNNEHSLWTVGNANFNTSDFYEFEIKPTTDDTKSNVSEIFLSNDTTTNQQYHQHQSIPSNDIEVTMCHMCDIEVPSAYLNDHDNSMKHKAYIQLADVILDRTRKHILMKSSRYVQRNDSMYFCGPCACVVQIADKDKHEKSKTHKQSVSIDRLLYELIAIYTNGEYGNSKESSLITNKTTSNEDVKDVQIKKDSNNVQIEVDANIGNTVLISNIKARLDELEFKTLEYYIKIIDECDVDKSYALSSVGNDIRISMEDRYELTVAADNFNGFIHIDKNCILCNVCNVIIVNEKQHKVSATHIKNIITPFEDFHCIRNLDNSTSHCVICNKIVTNPDLHILRDETHINLLHKALVINKGKLHVQGEIHNTGFNGFVNESFVQTLNNKSNGNQLQNISTVNATKLNANESKPNVDKTNHNAAPKEVDNITHFCHTCNLEMHINNIDSHINGTKHAMNCKSNVHYVMKQEEGSSNLLCRICNVYVQDDTDKVKEHVASSDHVFKYKDLLSTNYVIRHKDHFYCKPCDVNLLKMNEIYHIEKLNHTNKLDTFKETTVVNQNVNATEIVSNDLTSLDKSFAYFCKTCNVYVPNNSYNISSHNEGARHNNNTHGNQLQTISTVNATRLNANEIKLNVDKTNHNAAPKEVDNVTHYCHTCNLEMHINNIDSHNNGTKHAMNSKSNIHFCHTCNLEIHIKNLDSHINGKKHAIHSKSNVHYVMKQEEGSSNLLCRVCNVYIQDDTDQVKEHVASSDHVFKYKDLLSTNYVIRHNGHFYCKPCDANLLKMNELYHIEKLNHTNKLDAFKETKVVTEIKMTKKDDGTLSVDDKNMELYQKFKHHFMEKGDEWLSCKVCFDIDIPNVILDVITHTAKEDHFVGYKKLMSDNLIFQTEDLTYFCGICLCLVPSKGEVHHVKGARHTKNYVKETTQAICYHCNLLPCNMTNHITKPEHVTTLMKNQSLLHYCEFCKALMQKNKVEEHAKDCHRLAVKDKICFCTICDPFLPGT